MVTNSEAQYSTASAFIPSLICELAVLCGLLTNRSMVPSYDTLDVRL